MRRCGIFYIQRQHYPVSSFDGSVFSGNGEKSITFDKNEGFVNVPSGMTGGFWLKFTGNDGKVMYKSYASNTAIDRNYAVKIDNFIPVNVDLKVSVTGFPTSYSYYVANEGIEGITAKDVAKANSTSNGWMGAGKAEYTISCEGIPSKLLTFESFTLTVDGKTYTGDENSKTISTDASTGHNTWGQKDITATVAYKAVDGTEFTGTATVTRHITGLPYVANPPKNTGDNPWTSNYQIALNIIDFNTDNVYLTAISRAPKITSPAFSIPDDINILVTTNHSQEHHKGLFATYTTVFKVSANNSTIISNANECNKLELKGDGSFSKTNDILTCESTYAASYPKITLYSVKIDYR